MSSHAMRRIIASAKKALRRENHHQDAAQPHSGKVIFNLSLDPAPSGGYECWDNTRCGLCSRFLDRWFILQMFTSKFVTLGKTTDLLEWSQAGGRCSLCNYISLRLVEETKSQLPLDAEFIVRWSTKDTAVKGARRDEILSFDFELSWGYEQRSIQVRRVDLPCFTSEDQTMEHFVTTRPANPDVNSPAAFAKAKTWLSECVNGHTQCQEMSSGALEMPTRLLEITLGENDGNSIRLYKTTGQPLVYAALSYIWGGPQSCQTLKRNIDKYLQHIDLEKVPKTLLDAIHCTQKLGLKYLWVDSLCIIQDSAEDKAREIGLMSAIYKNAYVTISAAKATSCEEGFLEPRTSNENLLRSSFKLEILKPKDPMALSQWAEAHRLKDDFSNLLSTLEVEDLFKTSDWNHHDAWYHNPSTVRLAATPLGDSDEDDLLTAGEIEAEPISKRGWTLQESWLSRRMLIYGSRQLLWKCRAGVQVDGGLTASNLAWDHRNVFRTDEKGEMVDHDGNRASEHERMVILGRVWRDIVEQSSRRALTVAGDKLNALDGIVQELRRQAGDEYLAGLWKQRLVSELSWYQDSTHDGWESLLCNTERTCPSWSWISTDGPVSFSYAENSRVKVEDAKIVRNELIGEYPNSRLVVNGTITLRAPMSTLPIAQSLPNFTFPTADMPRLAFTNVIFPDGALTNPEFTIQTANGEAQIVAPDDMRFLELSWGKEEGNQNIASESRGLVLVPVQSEDGRKDVFQRIGYFIVALEQGLDMEGLVYSVSAEPGNVMSTEFGRLWKDNLREEVVLII